MNDLFGSSYGRSMSTDSMPSNISEDFSYLQNKISPYQLHSHVPLDEQILSEFNYPNKNTNLPKKPLHNPLLSPPNQEKLGKPDIQPKNLAPPKVHIPYQSHQKKIIPEPQNLPRDRQAVSFSEVENATGIKNDHPYDYQNFVKNHLKNLPLEIQFQVSPKVESRSRDQKKMSQIKTDVHRQSRSFDEGIEKQPQNSKHTTTNFQKLQSPKNFAICLPKVISIDKVNENLLLSGRSSQLGESYIDSKTFLNASVISQDDKLKTKLSPQGKIFNKLNWKEKFDFSNALLDAGKKLNKTQQQSISNSSRILPEEISLDKANLQMTLQESTLRQAIENENSYPGSVIEQSSVTNYDLPRKEPVRVLQNLNSIKRTQPDKENKTPSSASDSKGRKAARNIWNNYTEQMRKEMKQNAQTKENKHLHVNTLFEFGQDNEPSNSNSSDLGADATTLDKLPSANSKPSTFSSRQDDKSHRKAKSKLLKKNKSRGSIEISLPLQMDSSKNHVSINSRANDDEVEQASIDRNDENNEDKPQSAFASGQNKILSEYNSTQTNGQAMIEPYYSEMNQSTSSLKSRKDEDLSEFIRIEMGLTQEEQAFQPPCLIRNSMVLKKGIKQHLKETNNLIDQDLDKPQPKKTLSHNLQEKKLYDDQSWAKKNEICQNSFDEPSRANIPNLNIDTSISTTVKECPSIQRKAASKIGSESNNSTRVKNSNLEETSKLDMPPSKSSRNLSMPFQEIAAQNVLTNKRIRDMLSRKNENILINMLEKSGLNTSAEETNLQNSIRALLQAEQQKSLNSIEVFRSSNRLPTIEEMNSIQIQANAKSDNLILHEPEKGLVNVSHFSDRCISEPNGFYFKKSFAYEPDSISKSYDDLKCFGDLQNKLMEKNYCTPQSEYNLPQEKPQHSSNMRKIQSESKLGSSYSAHHLLSNSQKINVEDNKRQKMIRSPTAQLERFRHLFGKDSFSQNQSTRTDSIKRSRSKEPSFDQRDRNSISRTYHSKRSSVNAERSRDMSRFAFIPVETPTNIQTYTIVDKPKRSASSDPKLKTKAKPLSATNLTPLNMNLQKKFESYGGAITSKEHQKFSTGKLGKNLFR